MSGRSRAWAVLALLWGAALSGCGGDEIPVTLVAEEYVSVRTADGTESQVPIGSLVGHGAESATEVLVLDRRTGRRTWVAIDEALADPPPTARYLPLTSPAPTEAAPAE